MGLTLLSDTIFNTEVGPEVSERRGFETIVGPSSSGIYTVGTYEVYVGLQLQVAKVFVLVYSCMREHVVADNRCRLPRRW